MLGLVPPDQAAKEETAPATTKLDRNDNKPRAGGQELD
jgi:hypothetical protein